jgi:hypothetical protein
VTFRGGITDGASGTAIGVDGNPVVTGESCSTDFTACDFRTIKYDGASGAILWNVTFNSGGSNMDIGIGVAVGADGNPVVTGVSCAPDFTLCNFRTIKYDGATGALLWNVTFNSGGGKHDASTSVSVGTDGHPVATGVTCVPNFTACDFRTIKYDGGTGAILWNVTFDGGAEDQAYGVAIGPDGHPVVTGISCAPDFIDCDFRTIKYGGANGSVLWNVTFNSGGSNNDLSFAIGIGADGHPVVGGRSCSGPDYFDACDFRTIKHDGGTGDILWNVTFNSGGGNFDQVAAVAVGADGRPVVSGQSSPSAYSNDADFRTMKLDNTTGDVQWNVTFTGLGDFDVPNGVASGLDGNPVVTGSSCNLYPTCDFRTIKYLIQQETLPGTSVGVPFNGGTGAADGVSVTYDSVTTAGSTTLTASAIGPAPPAGFGFVGLPPTYYDIATTAAVTGPIQVCINYTNRPFAPPETDLKIFHYEGGSWVDVTTTLDTGANVICGSVMSLSPFAIGQAGTTVTSPGPGEIWVGLKNSDDVGIRFDLRAEVYRNGTELVGTGQIDSVPGGSSGFNNAIERTIALTSVGAVPFPSGSTLSVKLFVRNACTGSGKNSGTARLWFNDAAADSRVEATIGSPVTYYLRDGFALATTPGPGPKQKIDVAAGAKCSPFKSFGTWSLTLP